MLNIEIKSEGGAKYYLIINDMEFGDFYRSLGINCSAGRAYFGSREEAEKQAQCEKDWDNNNQKNPYEYGRY